MQKLVTLQFMLMVILVLSCRNSNINSPSIRKLEPIVEAKKSWITEGEINIATLIFNFKTYEFEGGAIQAYPLSHTAESDSLPFRIDYKLPGDFGHTLIQFENNIDTIYFSETVFRGHGEIQIPSNILPKDSFSISKDYPADPLTLEYFKHIGLELFPNDTAYDYESRANKALWVANQLEITKQFSLQQYHVGMYVFTPVPTIVNFYPGENGKWVIFLYARIE